MTIRVGQGFDAHRLAEGRPLWLGGVEVPHERGLEGHSDGDVLLHAVASALLGALGEGDLGLWFPSEDERLRDVPSSDLLARVVARVRERGFTVGNLDTTVIAQEPRLGPHRKAITEALAKQLDVPGERVNVKITSTDALGAIGRGEGIAAQAVVLLEGSDRAR
ncbi:MAG: 2-C-methyl-D-erythritol 2,4-cyclodiphosphate synthase [Deltaproteobacteria bacterium]|nr:2-C-methyl-D-erythritol 2,4-cyclodiphosphate synthase [Deltaproteobacteria bacterium]